MEESAGSRLTPVDHINNIILDWLINLVAIIRSFMLIKLTRQRTIFVDSESYLCDDFWLVYSGLALHALFLNRQTVWSIFDRCFASTINQLLVYAQGDETGKLELGTSRYTQARVSTCAYTSWRRWFRKLAISGVSVRTFPGRTLYRLSYTVSVSAASSCSLLLRTRDMQCFVDL